MTNEEERAGVNSELRIITLELMKLAHRRKASFSKISEEFVSNVCELEALLAYCASNEANAESGKNTPSCEPTLAKTRPACADNEAAAEKKFSKEKL